MKRSTACAILIIAGWPALDTSAAEPGSPPSTSPLAAIVPVEPRIERFSLERAGRYLDSAAGDWQRRHACTACHTMFPYLMARPALHPIGPEHAEIRTFFEDIVRGKKQAMPSYACKDVEGAVAVGIATAMAINDRSTTGRLHPLTRQALDRMWSLQRPDGSWQWPFRDTPPLKVNEHYGVTFAAVGAGMAPADYAKTPAAVAGLRNVRRYLRETKPVGLHQKGMLLWASVYVDNLLSETAKAEIISELMRVQRPDGGWAMGSLVDDAEDPEFRASNRVAEAKAKPGYGTAFVAYIGSDTTYESSLNSDGYATGFVIFVAPQAGLPAADVRLQRGVVWLKSNQRSSGRWFTPSQSWHSQNLISNAGTAYAILALQACGEVDGVHAR